MAIISVATIFANIHMRCLLLAALLYAPWLPCAAAYADGVNDYYAANAATNSLILSVPLMLHSTSERYSLADAAHASGFMPAPDGVPLQQALAYQPPQTFSMNPDFRRHGRYWLYLNLVNDSDMQQWMLHISNFGFIDPAVLVASADAQTIFHLRPQRDSLNTDINALGRATLINLPADQPLRLVVEVSASNPVWHPYIALMSVSEYRSWTAWTDIAFKSAVGIILGLVLLGFICWLLIGEWAFFWAAASVFMTLVYYLDHSSFPAVFWDWNYQRSEIFWWMISVSVFSQLAFAASFLKINRSSGRWYYAFLSAGVVTLLAGVISTLLPFRLNMLLFAVDYLLVAGVILSSGIARVRREGSYYIIYILGWLPMVLSATEVVAVTHGVNENPLVVTASYKMILVLYVQIVHMLLHAVALILRVKALREEKLKAEFISESKSRFIAQSSHDLSQPLNSMKLFLDHLQPYVREAAGEKIFRRLKQTHRQMSESFRSMMDLSRLEAGCITPEIKSVNLEEIFIRLRAEYRMLANDKGIGFTLRPCRLQVSTDPVLLERMLRNLISNAVKYTEKGRVLVAARRRGKQVVIEVYDTGCGISRQEQENIFDIYQRSRLTESVQDGTGIGLSVVQHISGLLHHPVQLKSEPGKGSRFSVRVPVAASVQGTAQSPGKSAHKVLLVVRDTVLCQQISERLCQWQYDVQTQTTLPDADETLRGLPVLICDYAALLAAGQAPAYPALGIVTGCICEPGTTLPQQWIAISTGAVAAQTRALLNVAQRRQQSALAETDRSSVAGH